MREEGPPHPVLGSPLPTSPHPRQGELSSVPWIPPHKDLTLRFLSSKRAPPPPSSWGSTGVQSLALRSPRPLPVTGSRTPPPHPWALSWCGHGSQEAQLLCPPQPVDGAQQGLQESSGLSRVPAGPWGPMAAPLPWRMDCSSSVTPPAGLGPDSGAVASVLLSPGAPASPCVPRLDPCLPVCGPGELDVWPPSRPLCSWLPYFQHVWPLAPDPGLTGLPRGGAWEKESACPRPSPASFRGRRGTWKGPVHPSGCTQAPAARSRPCIQWLPGSRVLFKCDRRKPHPQAWASPVLSS